MHNPPLLAVEAIHKGEEGIELLFGLMELEAVVTRIGGLIAAQQNLAAGYLAGGLALQKGVEVIGDRFGIGSVAWRERGQQQGPWLVELRHGFGASTGEGLVPTFEQALNRRFSDRSAGLGLEGMGFAGHCG